MKLETCNEFREVASPSEATQLCREGWCCAHVGEVDEVGTAGNRRVIVYVMARFHVS